MRGGIILGLMFFLMGLAVMVVFISPMQTFLNMAQQSDNLNCKGYIYQGNPSSPLSFNNTSNGGDSGSPMACLMLQLYLPYILLVFLIGGIAAVLAGKSEELMGWEEPPITYGGY